MFDNNHYVPILKWKRGERTALSELDPTHKKIMTPLIEIQPVPFDHPNGKFSKTLDEHLSGLGNQVKDSWNEDTGIFVDLNTLYENGDFEEELLESGQHPIEYAMDDVESNGIKAIPVTGIYRHDSFHAAIKATSKKHNRGLCLRLEESDISDIESLRVDIDRLLEFHQVEVSNVDLIIDYKQIIPTQEEQHLSNVALTILKLPYLNDWRTFTIASTAYPKNLNKIPTDSNGSLPRTEWKVYKALIELGLARIPAFGDYTITHPDFVNLDPRLINMAAGVKYTSKEEFLIFRGVGVRNNGFSQMIKICNDVIRHPDYYGKHFSFGDEYIYNCANEECTTGNAEKWVIVGVNHHLSVVANDVSNLPVSSTAHSQ
jgi:hypothetical protein